jgi:outer membrane protein assembly factor BamB
MKKSIAIIMVLLSVTFLLCSNPSLATTFHADEMRSGNFSEYGPENSELVYKVKLTPVHGSPIVSDGVVYVLSDLGYDPTWKPLYNAGEGLHAINATTGDILWNVSGIYGMSTPSVSGAYVFVHVYDNASGSGKLYSFYAVNGSEVWNRTIEPQIAYWYVASSPLVYNNSIYVLSYDGTLYRFDFDGNELWNLSIGNTLSSSYMSSPSAWNGTIYFIANVSNTYKLVAVDENGNEIWNRSVEGVIKASPALSNGIVYIPTTSKLYAFNASTGEELWNITFSGTYSTPSVYGERLYVGSTSGIHWFNSSTGEEIWNYSVGFVGSSPATSNGVVYFATNVQNGTIYALNATDGSLLWKYETNNFIMSSPFIYNGKLYIGADDGNLYIVGLWKGTVDLKPLKLTIELKDGSFTQIDGNSALAALIKASEKGKFSVTVANSTWGLYVENIGNIQPQGWDGWMYCVNGIMPDKSSPDYRLKDGDVVEFFYGSWGISPDDARYRLIIHVNLSNVIWNGTVELKEGNFTAIVNNKSYEISNLTALGALNVASLIGKFNYSLNDEWYESYGLIVNSIYGIENNGTSGWMYWVNYPKESMPTNASNVYPVEDGDVVYWYYSTSLNDTPETSPYVIKIEVRTKIADINNLSAENGQRGGYINTIVNLTSYYSGWLVIVVSGTNENGDSIAGTGVVMASKGERIEVPIIIAIPQQVQTGNYNLYAAVYKLSEYSEKISEYTTTPVNLSVS